jgi:CRISPR/Cas system-associated exonuclease Cas4 (RecB family)
MVIDVNSDQLVKKPEPNVWVTWLAKLLADPSECYLPAWVQTRFSVNKDNTFTGDWALRHANIIEQVAKRLSASSRQVRIEQEIAVISRTGLRISGTMDIWAPEAGKRVAIIVDAKTGKHKPSHRLQINLYQLMTNLNQEFRCTHKPGGLIAYTDSEIWIKPTEASPELAKKVAAAMEIIASDIQPLPSPSRNNCRYCSIGHICQSRQSSAPFSAPLIDLF